MPFLPRAIAPELVAKLEEFAKTNDFADLYKRYNWRNDTYRNGFPEILKLELRLSASDKSNGISREDVLAILKWGRLPNPKQIRWTDGVLKANTLHTDWGAPNPNLEADPLSPTKDIKKNDPSGLGPTYISKVLRFALAEAYGAIDTRCVRVFGKGDPTAARQAWLTLRVQYNDRWYIQSGWPTEYGTWINILRYFRRVLPYNCPHPAGFVDAGQRREGKWTCADIEMVLFCYASQFT